MPDLKTELRQAVGLGGLQITYRPMRELVRDVVDEMERLGTALKDAKDVSLLLQTLLGIDPDEDMSKTMIGEMERLQAEVNDQKVKIGRLEKENKVLRLKAEGFDRLPFCPDHRDKVRGKPCRECEIEWLRGGLDSIANCSATLPEREIRQMAERVLRGGQG